MGKCFQIFLTISVLLLESIKKFQVLVIILARKKFEQLNYSSSLLFTNWAKTQNYVSQNWNKFKYFKNRKFNNKTSFWIREKSVLFQTKSALFSWISAVSEKISAETASLTFISEIFFSGAVQSWISAVQRFLNNEQRWIRAKILLNQSWITLTVSETSIPDFRPLYGAFDWRLELPSQANNLEYSRGGGGLDKTADFKWDKTADFGNKTKPPILKWD